MTTETGTISLYRVSSKSRHQKHNAEDPNGVFDLIQTEFAMSLNSNRHNESPKFAPTVAGRRKIATPLTLVV